MASFKERRSSARLVGSLPASIRHPGFESNCRILNLSSNGILCSVDRSIAPMTKIELILELPSGDSKPQEMRVEGVVVRHETVGEEDRVAVFFTDISKNHQMYLEKYIADKLKK